MSGKALSGLLAALLAFGPSPVWGALLSVPTVKTGPTAAVSPLPMTAGSIQAPGLAPGFPSLQASLVAQLPAPAVPAVQPQASPLRVLTQTELVSHRVMEPGPQEAAAVRGGAVFDQSSAVLPSPVAAVPDLDLRTSGLSSRGAKLFHEGRPLTPLGRGDFGAVYEHPRMPGAVIKLMVFSLVAAFTLGSTPAQAARQDLRVAQRLAQADAGPKVMGLAAVPGKPGFLRRWLWGLFGKEALGPARPAVVKERIYGKTVGQLIEEGRFTPQDYALVQDMLSRMADARVRVSDLRAANIIIGTTADDPRPRAYMVDGGELLPVAKSESREALYESLRYQRTVPIQVGGAGSGQWGELSYDPFDDILQAGLARGARSPAAP